jgi:hypothetical protein
MQPKQVGLPFFLKAVSLACVSVAASGCITIYDRIQDSDLPVIPMTLREGMVYRSKPFTISYIPEEIRNYGYVAAIEFQKTVPFETLDCLVVAGSLTKKLNRCGNTEPVIDVTWKIYSDGVLYAEGRHTPGTDFGAAYGQKTIEIGIGAWKINNLPKTFVLEVDVNRDAPQLDGTSPTIRVYRPGPNRG